MIESTIIFDQRKRVYAGKAVFMIISLRPLTFRFFCVNIMQDEKIYAGVAELANALDLGSSGALLAGSSPVARTKQKAPSRCFFAWYA